MVWLENKEGTFVQPHGGSGFAMLLHVDLPENLRVFFPDPAGKDSYPIVTYSWALLYKKYDNPQKLVALKQYMKWNFTVGQEFSGTLGYIRLPPAVAERAVAVVDSLS